MVEWHKHMLFPCIHADSRSSHKGLATGSYPIIVPGRRSLYTAYVNMSEPEKRIHTFMHTKNWKAIQPHSRQNYLKPSGHYLHTFSFSINSGICSQRAHSNKTNFHLRKQLLSISFLESPNPSIFNQEFVMSIIYSNACFSVCKYSNIFSKLLWN